jgi:hypothetical protein
MIQLPSDFSIAPETAPTWPCRARVYMHVRVFKHRRVFKKIFDGFMVRIVIFIYIITSNGKGRSGANSPKHLWYHTTFGTNASSPLPP